MKHKKLPMLLLFLLGVCLLQSSATVFADMTDSKQTKVGVELKQVIAPGKDLPGVDASQNESPTPPTIFKNSQGVLPKTGEWITQWYRWIGFVFVLFASIFYFFKNRTKGRQ